MEMESNFRFDVTLSRRRPQCHFMK